MDTSETTGQERSELSRQIARRRVLIISGGLATSIYIAGCVQDNSQNGGDEMGTTSRDTATTAADGEPDEELPDGVSAEEFENGPVPEQYRSAISLGSEDRNTDDLTPKSEANFMEASEAVEQGFTSEGNSCANCADFIPDLNGDGFGACAEVAGYIGTEDWCALWEELELDEDEELPAGVSAEEFVIGPVPEPYRGATSQGNEQRDPQNLRYKASVNFMEASHAVEEGLTSEDNSCANCADFIPDQNGDGFGACAEVEGYVGSEDWCVIWEPLEE